MFNCYKRTINKIYPLFDDFENIESLDNINDTDDCIINIFCYIDEKNNNYLYSYTINKNDFPIRSNIKSIKHKLPIEILSIGLIDALNNALKYNIKEIIVNTNNSIFFDYVKSKKNKNINNIEKKFNNIKYIIISDYDNSKNRKMCEKFLGI